MNKIIVAATVALALLGGASTAALARPHHMHHVWHWKTVCTWHNHHKHCHKVRY